MSNKEEQSEKLLEVLEAYVSNLDKHRVKNDLLEGDDVELRNLQLKPEALNALVKLPSLSIKAGFLGSVSLSLGQEPVSVHLDKVFLLVELANVEGGCTVLNPPSIEPLFYNNLKISISNVHVRFADPDGPFISVGLTVGELLDVHRGTLNLKQFAVYVDSKVYPWEVEIPRGGVSLSDWSLFHNVGECVDTHLIRFIKEHSNVNLPSVIKLNNVSRCITFDNYREFVYLCRNIIFWDKCMTLKKNDEGRPSVSVTSDYKAWWKYLVKGVIKRIRKLRIFGVRTVEQSSDLLLSQQMIPKASFFIDPDIGAMKFHFSVRDDGIEDIISLELSTQVSLGCACPGRNEASNCLFGEVFYDDVENWLESIEGTYAERWDSYMSDLERLRGLSDVEIGHYSSDAEMNESDDYLSGYETGYSADSLMYATVFDVPYDDGNNTSWQPPDHPPMTIDFESMKKHESYGKGRISTFPLPSTGPTTRSSTFPLPSTVPTTDYVEPPEKELASEEKMSDGSEE